MPVDDHDTPLRASARGFAEVILTNIRTEYPNDLRHPMSGPDDRPRPRELHPAFYGCYDWHSCVEMHWALVRLARLLPAELPQADLRAALDAQLTAEAIAAEAAYLDAHRTFKRPYGWGWALMLVHEFNTWDDPDARRWAANLAPLGATLTARYLEWLPKATYPERASVHNNSAFGLARALRSPPRGPSPVTVPSWPPSPTPRTAGSATTGTTRAAGSRLAATSCHRRWSRPN